MPIISSHRVENKLSSFAAQLFLNLFTYYCYLLFSFVTDFFSLCLLLSPPVFSLCFLRLFLHSYNTLPVEKIVSQYKNTTLFQRSSDVQITRNRNFDRKHTTLFQRSSDVHNVQMTWNRHFHRKHTTLFQCSSDVQINIFLVSKMLLYQCQIFYWRQNNVLCLQQRNEVE